jgi:hypothetical protein
MGKKQQLNIDVMGEKWSFIFKMRRKNYFNKANYTFNYYVNQDRTKILEEDYTKYIIRTCPIYVDDIITCYFNSDYFNALNSWKLLDVVNNSFKYSCKQCVNWVDNKCQYWEPWINGVTLVDPDTDDGPMTIKEINSFHKIYEINNDQNKTT